jgi:hypothetical protein
VKPGTHATAPVKPRISTVWLDQTESALRAKEPVIVPGESGESELLRQITSADPVEVYDLNPTILHLLGIEHTRLTYKFQGRDFRLTDVHGKMVRAILA